MGPHSSAKIAPESLRPTAGSDKNVLSASAVARAFAQIAMQARHISPTLREEGENKKATAYGWPFGFLLLYSLQGLMSGADPSPLIGKMSLRVDKPTTTLLLEANCRARN